MIPNFVTPFSAHSQKELGGLGAVGSLEITKNHRSLLHVHDEARQMGTIPLGTAHSEVGDPAEADSEAGTDAFVSGKCAMKRWQRATLAMSLLHPIRNDVRPGLTCSRLDPSRGSRR